MFKQRSVNALLDYNIAYFLWSSKGTSSIDNTMFPSHAVENGSRNLERPSQNVRMKRYRTMEN